MSLHAISAIKNIAFTILKKKILLNTASPKKIIQKIYLHRLGKEMT